jgi:hypothetical protein
VAVSHDGGRSWLDRALPEELLTNDGDTGSAGIATADGRTVYAVGRVGGALRIYRSDNGGETWHRTTAAWTVGQRAVFAAIDPGGDLFIESGVSLTGEVLLLRSSDHGQSVHQAPFGPGAAAQPVAGGFVQPGGTAGSGAWIHPNGGDWEYVALTA